jgi:hypothetical protein
MILINEYLFPLVKFYNSFFFEKKNGDQVSKVSFKMG